MKMFTDGLHGAPAGWIAWLAEPHAELAAIQAELRQ